jgi:biofilm protein TabA
MIIGTLSACERYYALGEGFKKAFEFLKSNDICTMSPGRYDIDYDKVYVFVQEYVSKTIDNCCLETHRRYADVQYVAEGFEYFGYASLERAGKPITEYDPKADAVFFEKECQYILLQKGDFAVVFPDDAHMTQKRAFVPVPVRKACVKVLVK